MDETKKNDSALAQLLTSKVNTELGALVDAQRLVIEHLSVELAKSRVGVL